MVPPPARRCVLSRRFALLVLAGAGLFGCSGAAKNDVDALAARTDAGAPNAADAGAPDVIREAEEPENPADPRDQPLVGLARADLDLFDKGDKLFEGAFGVADGLGPLYIRAACGDCHVQA